MKRKCECGRILKDDEETKCPACLARSSSRIRRWVEGIATVVVAVGLYAIKNVSGGKNN